MMIPSEMSTNSHHHDRGQLRWICQNPQECGGLGDRLYGIVMALYIAMMTNRTFHIVLPGSGLVLNGSNMLSSKSPTVSFLEPALIDWSIPSSSSPLYDSQLTSNNKNNNNQPLPLLRVRDDRRHPLLLEPCTHAGLFMTSTSQYSSNSIVHLQVNILTHEPILRNSSCFQQYCRPWKGCLDNDDDDDTSQQQQHTAHHRSLFHIGFWALFQWPPHVNEHMRQLKASAGMDNETIRPYIAMHVRTGQAETWEDPLRHAGDDNLRLFHTCARRLQHHLQQHCGGDQATIPVYIASDNNYAKVRIPQLNSEDHAQEKEASFYANTDMEILHMSKSRQNEMENVGQAVRHVWSELRILMDATCIVMSHSKFSYMGAELSPQQPRCAVLFDECDEPTVATAVRAVSLPCVVERHE